MDMQAVSAWLDSVASFVWGPALLVLLLGVGLYLTLALRFMPMRRIGTAFRLLFRKSDPNDPGEITPFQTLMTALAATIGTGNIAGVATAIALGGPGAVFWMWMTALVGMATKYAEAVLAIKYREVDAEGRYVGGPMYYIKNGLGKNWAWLGFLFALFAALAGFGIGNMTQSNSVTAIVTSTFPAVPNWAVGAVLAALTFAVIIGGVKRIGAVAQYLVPFMAIAYIFGGLAILAANYQDIPEGIAFIVRSAFTETAATGGFAGAAVWAGIRFGVARGVFSNEAGLGSAAIAHAAARATDAVQQGMIAMLGVFIDTLVVCSITALVIVTVHVPVEVDGMVQSLPAWASGVNGADLTALAFANGLPGIGQWVVSAGLVLFTFTTILGWSYYGERAAEYLCGVKVILPYRLLWVAFVFVGSVLQLSLVWTITDILNALMAIPNLIALLLLSGVVFSMTRASATASKGKIEPATSQ